MQDRWEESLTALNTYVTDLKVDNVVVTLATFDTPSEKLEFDVLRDSVEAKSWVALTSTEAIPRGMTPLFDAIGRLAILVEKANAEKTIVVIVTDGAENRSVELKKTDAGKIVEGWKSKNWQVVFLGADFNAFGEASSVGVGHGQVLNMTSGFYEVAARNVSAASSNYFNQGSGIVFSEEDRNVASGN